MSRDRYRIDRNTRVYRGGNGRYYCRRNDGSTGLIVGAAVGGLLGNALGDGDSGLLSTILGAGVGGALGREIDRGNVYCE
ncbi:glycine zipper 2TM domain-containing protein [Sphingobium scionense]|uniref:17 kDa surface antigen n=1 Tax=Sphingobium scionense TaxID=1404341 RepID=A0A7W6PVK0_9SPHN|nr:glycine zipper 2TM domain-containing protein [Sphingobium scionense]MBB4147297.1 outer membrane lipoprotein SlyB [Sphingobium scionense]